MGSVSLVLIACMPLHSAYALPSNTGQDIRTEEAEPQHSELRTTESESAWFSGPEPSGALMNTKRSGGLSMGLRSLLPRAATVFQHTITGTVTDAQTGEPLVGVNILVQGTTVGTTTGLDGTYSIDVEGPGAVLMVSYIGYSSITVTVAPENLSDGLNIELVEDVALLDELVVVGFGTQRRADITGAVSTVSAVDIERRPLGNTAQIGRAHV